MQITKIGLFVAVSALLLLGSNAFMPTSLTGLKRSANLRSSTSVQMKVDLLQKVETLKVLTAVSKAGILSKVEKAGLLSKLEKQVPFFLLLISFTLKADNELSVSGCVISS